MQNTDAKLKKNSLSLMLKRYSSAVSNMERTILLPSLLRDEPSDWMENCEAAQANDLYGNFMMLRTIRNTAESSLVLLEEQDVRRKEPRWRPEPDQDTDSEALFEFHLRGLCSVMNDLTKKTQSLTAKYLSMIGVAQ
uniref:Thyroid hormone responsive n=1 Tax=Oryzias sinensis TaxID=183150 RepID=A0A8C8E419_9TELE